MKVLYQKILDHIESYKRVIVAFSGGVDSSLLLKLSIDALLKDSVLAITAVSPSLSKEMLEDAKQIAQGLNADHRLIHTREMLNRDYRKNSSDRCFHCKTELYQTIAEKFKGYFILNGTNADDLFDYRPGIKAAKKFRIRSPFVDLKIDKKTIRDLSLFLGLSFWNKPSSPCLASRIPYGQGVNVQKLTQIERAEELLKSKGFLHFRVRHHGEIARIEVRSEQTNIFTNKKLRESISKKMREIGFLYTTLDLEEFRSGSLNRGLS